MFEAEVNVWEFKEDAPYHGEYTTKNWRRHYISYCADERGNPKNGSPYRYFGNGIAFVTEADFKAWLRTYRSVTFEGYSENQTVVFGYKETDYLIEKSDWDKLDLQRDTRLCNGINLCKVRYDDETHTVHVYRFSNSGQLDPRRFKAYALARGTDLSMAGGVS